MGLIALEFLYGLFLFAVMSTNKRHREEARAAAELHANTAPVEPPLAPKIEAVAKPVPVSEPATSEVTTTALPTQEKVEPEASKTATLESQTLIQNKATNELTQKSNTEPNREARNDKKTVALATPEPPPTKVKIADKNPLSIFPLLGPLVDPLQDSLVTKGDETLTIQVAAGAHIFDATRDITDAPRALAEVDGDFTAEVKVLGDFQPGTVPLKGLFFTFQGAGLLLWQNKDNYVRFERATAYTGERLQWLYLESCKDGKLTKPKKPMNVREGAITLRLERRANALVYSYSLDGKTFIKVDHTATTLPRKLSVGISANNASPRAFPARFTDFVLKPAS